MYQRQLLVHCLGFSVGTVPPPLAQYCGLIFAEGNAHLLCAVLVSWRYCYPLFVHSLGVPDGYCCHLTLVHCFGVTCTYCPTPCCTLLRGYWTALSHILLCTVSGSVVGIILILPMACLGVTQGYFPTHSCIPVGSVPPIGSSTILTWLLWCHGCVETDSCDCIINYPSSNLVWILKSRSFPDTYYG